MNLLARLKSPTRTWILIGTPNVPTSPACWAPSTKLGILSPLRALRITSASTGLATEQTVTNSLEFKLGSSCAESVAGPAAAGSLALGFTLKTGQDAFRKTASATL